MVTGDSYQEGVFAVRNLQRVFYYPAAGSDFKTLPLFTRVCSEFVYCDYSVTQQSIIDELTRLPQKERYCYDQCHELSDLSCKDIRTHDVPLRSSTLENWRSIVNDRSGNAD